MAKPKDEMKQLKKEQRTIYLALLTGYKKRLYSILEDSEVGGGYKLIELCCKMMKKQNATFKDLRTTYGILTEIRNESAKCLAYWDGKYSWTSDKEKIDNQCIKNLVNGLMKSKRNIKVWPTYYVAAGIKGTPNTMIKHHLEEFGVELIENKQK